METTRSYILNFGDSTRYRVYFAGTKEEFEASDVLKGIKEKVYSFLKEKFPAGGYENIVELSVADDDHRNYEDLDDNRLEELCKSVAKQVEVAGDTRELNNNAPFDKI